jgi:dTDP-4-amino-4,6-dideoxygalactose transaminase
MNMKELFWYPPAETKLSKKALLESFKGGIPDFEKTLSSYLGMQPLILGDSGRGLLAELLKALKKKYPGRTCVMIPGYTCYSVAASVVNAGLEIRLYDINPQTLAPDMKSLEENCSQNTLAVLVQHLFGIPVRMDYIKAFSSRAGIWLIEDAAQGLGGSIDGKPLGTTGDFGLFSFGRGKPLPLGCGGAFTGKHPDILKQMVLFPSGTGRTCIIKAALVKILSHPLLYGMLERLPLGLGKTVFDPVFNCKTLPQRVNVLGSLSFNSLTELNNHRRRISSIYSKRLSGLSVPVPETGIAVFTRFPVMAGNNAIPLKLKRLGVRRMYPKALNDEPEIAAAIVNKDAAFAGSSSVAENLVTLPTHSGISGSIADTISEEVAAWIKSS